MDGITVPVESGYFKNTPHYNTEDWCESALHFKEFGRYTNIYVDDANPVWSYVFGVRSMF